MNNLEIRALSPALLDDYLHYFDEVAFADHKEWADCYCIHFHRNPEQDSEWKIFGGHRSGRDYAIELVKEGRLQGYLAYWDENVVGWCNANDKTKYVRFLARPELWSASAPVVKVKSIVCFSVAPKLRRQGIASQLLDRVCQDAKAQGYDYVEAYPCKEKATDIYSNYLGHGALYAKYGFIVHQELTDEFVVRKYFQEMDKM